MNETQKKLIESEAIRTGFHYHPGTGSYSLGKHIGHIRGFIEGARFAMGMMENKEIKEHTDKCLKKSNNSIKKC